MTAERFLDLPFVIKNICEDLDDERIYDQQGRLVHDLKGILIISGNHPEAALHWDAENRMIKALPFGRYLPRHIFLPILPDGFMPGVDPEEIARNAIAGFCALVQNGMMPDWEANAIAILEELKTGGREE